MTKVQNPYEFKVLPLCNRAWDEGYAAGLRDGAKWERKAWLKELKTYGKSGPTGEQKSQVNPGLTRSQVVGIIREWLEGWPPEKTITGLMELRIQQVVKNQRRPRYVRS